MSARRLGLLALAFLCGRAPASEGDVYAALRAARPGSPAVSVHDLVLNRDAFTFRLTSGTFHFLPEAEGRVWGAVFTGEGLFELTPALENERRHLAYVSGRKDLRTLSDRFRSLVLLFSDGTADEIRAHGTPSGEPPGRAGGAWDAFLKAERKTLKTNLHVRVLEDLLGGTDPGDGVFLAYLPGKSFPAAVAAVDPRGLGWLDRDLLAAGEGVGLLPANDDHDGFWYLAPLAKDPGSGTAAPRRRLAAATHYSIETEVVGRGRLRGTTAIQLVSFARGLRVLPLRLMGKLRIQEIALARGNGPPVSCAFVQEKAGEDDDAAAVLPEPLAAGETATLRVAYEGTDVLTDAGEGNFAVEARESWYPNLGVFGDPATFDLTYRVPAGNEVVSVGELVEDRRDGDARVFRFAARRPIRVAGFNYGKFRKLEQRDEASHVLLQVFANTGTPDVLRDLSGVDTASLADLAMADAINTARVGTASFGPLAEPRVAITQQVQMAFGQSWPSLVFLPLMAFLDAGNRYRLGLQRASDFVELVGPHEVAHQWWGHQVGWASYRDQWLSEGFAQFTSALVLEQTAGKRRYDQFWEKARRLILAKPPQAAVANDQAGPITQGQRLATHRNRFAYQAMVYEKGAFVLHMLRLAMRDPEAFDPDARFFAMMRDFATTWRGRAATTRDFERVAERHLVPALDAAGDGSLDWFFGQWVDGIEIPRYVARLSIESAPEGRWRVRGTVAQEAVSPGFRSVVPVYVELERGVLRIGSITLDGPSAAPVNLLTPAVQKPRRAIVNALHDILARD